MALKFAAVAALGAPAIAVLIFEVLLNATAMFNHGNVGLPPRLDRILRWIVVTPDMHRVHHSVLPNETNSNFGFNLPWWDRLLGTYREQPAMGQQGMTIELEIFRDPAQLRLDRMLSNLWREPQTTIRSTGSNPRRESEQAFPAGLARQRGGVIDVVQRLQQGIGRAAQIGARVGERMCARPPHAVEGIDATRPPAQADRPVATVRRRSENRVMAAEQMEGAGDFAGRDSGNVGADDQHRPGRQKPVDAGHARAQVAASLRQDADARRPGAGAVGRYGSHVVQRGSRPRRRMACASITL